MVIAGVQVVILGEELSVNGCRAVTLDQVVAESVWERGDRGMSEGAHDRFA